MIIKTGKQAAPPPPAKPNGGSLIRNEKLQQLYATMLKCRVLEERAWLLASHRRLAPDYAAAVGHEAAEVGCTIDLQREDLVASAPHALIGSFLHGIPHSALPQIYKHPGNAEDIPLPRTGLRSPSVRDPRLASDTRKDTPGNASTRFGAGIELASRLKKTRNVIVAFSAAGGFSGGMWHEALSAAGAESLPIIFVRHDQLAEKTANVQSGGSQDYGFPRIPVDGRDVVAVYRVAHESIQRARRGGGPTLIECEPYVPDVHGPDTRGRNRVARPKEWRTEKDPIRHMELYLTRKGLFRKSWKNQLVAEFSRKLDAAIDAVEQE